MQASVHVGLEGLKALEGSWRKLHQALGVFARYEWHLACAMYLLGDCDFLSYVLLAQGGEPIAIVPVIETLQTVLPFGSLRALTLGTHSHLSLMEIPVAPGADFGAVAAALRSLLWRWPRRWDVLWWRRCVTRGNAAQLGRALSAVNGGRGFFPETPPCNVLVLSGTFEECMQQRSKNLRNSLRKSVRRLLETGVVHVSSNGVPQSLDGGPACAAPVETPDTAFEHFLDLEASGWKGAGGTGSAIRLDPRTREFYACLMDASAPGFETEVTLLHHDGRPIAAHFSITTGTERTLLKIGYDESESKQSPGQVLLREVLQSLPGRGVAELSLVTNMPWHHTWRPAPEPTHSVLIYRRRWRHVVHATLRQAFKQVRSMVRRLSGRAEPAGPGSGAEPHAE